MSLSVLGGYFLERIFQCNSKQFELLGWLLDGGWFGICFLVLKVSYCPGKNMLFVMAPFMEW